MVRTEQSTRGKRHAEAKMPALHQRYSLWQRIRASLYGRLLKLGESLIALLLIVLVVLGDVLFFLSRAGQPGYPTDARDVGQALLDALGILTLTSPVRLNAHDSAGTVLFVFNFLFSILFIQSVLNSARAFFSKRPLEARQRGLAAALGDHVIVCGAGRMGLRLVTRLVEAGVKTVVVEQNPQAELTPRVMAMGVPVISGDARDLEVQRNAGVRRARAILAAIDGDLVDVEIALAARAENPAIRAILRAFNEDFDRGLEKRFGANTAFSASALAAPTFAAAAATRGIEHVLPLDSQLLAAAHLSVPAQQSTGGLTIRGLEETFSIRVLHLTDAEGRALPQKSARAVRGGDCITIVGALPAIRSLLQAGFTSTAPSAMHAPTVFAQTEGGTGGIIVCGLGKVGYRVVDWLYRMPGHPEIVSVHLDDDEHRSFSKRIQTYGGVRTIYGDARDAAKLLEAGLRDAAAVAAVTSGDLVNLQIALEARRIRPDVHVVLRVFSDQLADQLVDLFGIHTAYSTSDLASPTLVAAAVAGNVSHAFYADGRLYAVRRETAQAGDGLAGQTVEAIRAARGVLAVGIERGASGALELLPRHDQLVAAGDAVTELAPLQALSRVRTA